MSELNIDQVILGIHSHSLISEECCFFLNDEWDSDHTTRVRTQVQFPTASSQNSDKKKKRRNFQNLNRPSVRNPIICI